MVLGTTVTPNHTVRVGGTLCGAVTWAGDAGLSCQLEPALVVGEYSVTVTVAGVASTPFPSLSLLCPKGYYGGWGEPCRGCPVGGVCPGGLEEPYAAPSFFPLSRTAFVGCTPPEACLGGPNATCFKLYTGDRCAACALGAYR